MAKAVKPKKWKASGERFYPVDGDEFASVTTALSALDKPALIQWSANEAAAYMVRYSDEFATATEERREQIIKSAKNAHRTAGRDAMDIGTMVHQAIEVHLAGGDPSEALDKNDAATNSFLAFLEMQRTLDFKPVHLEQLVINRPMRYAGRCDFIGTVNGVLTILDWKSSKGFYEPDMPAQLSAYVMARESETDDRFEQAGIVRLDKLTGEPEIRIYNRAQLNLAFNVFCGALRAFYGRKEWEAANE